LAKFEQIYLFGPVLLGLEKEEFLTKFGQLQLFGPILLGPEKEEIFC
jgi:hypothetical protein